MPKNYACENGEKSKQSEPMIKLRPLPNSFEQLYSNPSQKQPIDSNVLDNRLKINFEVSNTLFKVRIEFLH